MAYKPVLPTHPSEAAQYGYKEVTNAAAPASAQQPVASNGYTPITYTPVSVYQPGQTLDSFTQQATNQYTPAYNEKVAALKAALAKNLAALEGQKLGINQNYDNQTTNQNINNTRTKNNYSNTMLGRGLGRSSIVGTGLSEYDLVNNRALGQIEQGRTSALGNVDAQKVATETGTNDQIAGMASDLQTQILALAQSLYDSYQKNLFNQESFNASNKLDTDKYNTTGKFNYDQFEYGKTQDAFNNDLKTKDYDLDVKNYDLDKWYKEQQVQQAKNELAAQIAANKSRSSSSSSNSNSNKAKTYNSTNGSVKTADYSDAVQQVNYLMNSKDYSTDQKMAALNDTYKRLMAEMNSDATGVAKYVQTLLGQLSRNKSYEIMSARYKK